MFLRHCIMPTLIPHHLPLSKLQQLIAPHALAEPGLVNPSNHLYPPLFPAMKTCKDFFNPEFTDKSPLCRILYAILTVNIVTVNNTMFGARETTHTQCTETTPQPTYVRTCDTANVSLVGTYSQDRCSILPGTHGDFSTQVTKEH